MQARLNSLYTDSRFTGVSQKTKTDIISTLGIELDEETEKKFTKEQLQEALHYLLAKHAGKNQDVLRLLTNDESYSIGMYDPFYFSEHDPFWTFFVLNELTSHHHSHNHNSFFGGGGDDNCSDEGAVVVMGLVCVCAAGVFCVYCTMQAYEETAESPTVKNIKLTLSTVTGILSFILMTYYFLSNDVLKHELVDEHDFDVGGYRFVMILLAAVGALTAAGTVSTINRYLTCEPKTKEPELSAEAKEALKELATVESLLEKGWSRDGDDIAQCDTMIREVINIYIDNLSLQASKQDETRIVVNDSLIEDLEQQHRIRLV